MCFRSAVKEISYVAEREAVRMKISRMRKIQNNENKNTVTEVTQM